MVHGKNRIPYWIDRRLTGLAGPEYDATISFGLPFESEDCPYGESRFIDAPAVGADISLLVVVLIITPLAFLARFRRSRRIGWLTLTLAVLWFVQHSLGYGIADARWIETIHIPLALVIFGLALYLTDRAYRALKGHAG